MKRLLSLFTGLYITSILIASPLQSATQKNADTPNIEHNTQFDNLETAITKAERKNLQLAKDEYAAEEAARTAAENAE